MHAGAHNANKCVSGGEQKGGAGTIHAHKIDMEFQDIERLFNSINTNKQTNLKLLKCLSILLII